MDEIESENLKQDRLLEEKKMSRQNRKKIREMEIAAKQLGQLKDKEIDLLNKKYQTEVQTQEAKTQKELANAIKTYEQRADGQKKEEALILVNEIHDDLLKKKLKLLVNKQFFELEKNLGTLYTQNAMKKMIDKERIKDNYTNQEQEAFVTL